MIGTMRIPLTSVIIPAYNCADFVGGAIRSALGQTYGNVEVIVVDDGSTDATADAVKNFGPRVRYVRQENRGLAGARNTGIRESRGRYVAILDADDTWLPEKLERQVALLEKASFAGLAVCGFAQVSVTGEVIGEFAVAPCPDRESLVRSLTRQNVIFGGGSTALIRGECFEKVGLFDESLRSSEDWDMWFRIALKYDLVVDPAVLARITVRTDSLSAVANAEKMLASELAVLDKISVLAPLAGILPARKKACAYRYSKAAWAFCEAGNRSKAVKSLFRCLFNDPLGFIATRERMGLLVKVALGSSVFRSIKRLIPAHE
jgi:Glycosyltransferases involved in cell wall biogenesis